MIFSRLYLQSLFTYLKHLYLNIKPTLKIKGLS